MNTTQDALSGTGYNVYSFALMFRPPGLHYCIIRLCVHVLSPLQVILGNREMQASALPVDITGLTLAVGATYGIGVVARNSIGESKTFVGTFSVPTAGKSPQSVHGLQA